MEEQYMFKMKADEMKMHIEKGRVVSFGRGAYLVSCIRGTLWITWPGSGDVILREGEEFMVRQHGRLCITSLNGAFVMIKRKTILPLLREIPRLSAVKLIELFLAYLRGGGEQSAFGDSVHSIIR